MSVSDSEPSWRTAQAGDPIVWPVSVDNRGLRHTSRLPAGRTGATTPLFVTMLVYPQHLHRFLLHIIALTIFLARTPGGHCATDVTRNIEVPTTFIRSQSPYKIADGTTVVVFAQASLTMQAGTTVRAFDR